MTEYLTRLKAEWILAREDRTRRETQAPLSTSDLQKFYQEFPLKEFEVQTIIIEVSSLERTPEDENTEAKIDALLERAISVAKQLEEYRYLKEQDTMSYLRRRSYWTSRVFLPYIYWRRSESK